jgi:aminopeptidase N
LLCTKTENKTPDEYIFQYKNAGKYLDRREAIDAISKKQDDPKAAEFMKTALKDKYHGLRSFTLNRLDLDKENVKRAVEPVLIDLAKNDPERLVKASAISKLAEYRKAAYAPLFRQAINDSSYTVSGNALEALSKIDTAAAKTEAKRLSAIPSKGKLASVVKKLSGSVDGNKLLTDFEAMPLGQTKFNALDGLFEFLESTTSLELFKRGVDDILQLEKDIPEQFREQATAELNKGLREIQKGKIADGKKEQADYIDSKLPKEKGFTPIP